MSQDTKTEDGGPAFPSVTTGIEGMTIKWYHGMSLRDYLAAAALQGTCASFNKVSACTDSPKEARQVAQSCYLYADAMLRAREGT